IRENDHEFQRLPNLRIQLCLQARVSRRARSCRCCNPPGNACRARSGGEDIDRYPSSLLSAALSQATDGVGGRAQDPALSRRTGLDAGEGGRTNGQEWHQNGGAVARIYARPVVRRWPRSGEQDGEVVPRLRGRDAEGLSGALWDLCAALDDG